MSDNQIITGGAALAEFLKTLPLKLEKNIMRSALAAGARVIAAEVKAKAPVGPPSTENVKLYGAYAGALRDSVRVSTKNEKGGKISAKVTVGGQNKKGAKVFYAHFVEFGTKAHKIKPGKKRAMALGGALLTTTIDHPGAKPKPFVRPAFDSKSGAAMEAVAAQIRARLTKEGIDVPAPVPAAAPALGPVKG